MVFRDLDYHMVFRDLYYHVVFCRLDLASVSAGLSSFIP